MSTSVFTNQSRSLEWRLARDGIGLTVADLENASELDPIQLHATDIDITRDPFGVCIHFCRSDWKAVGIARGGGPDLPVPHVRFRCGLPFTGRRYTLDAELYMPPNQSGRWWW